MEGMNTVIGGADVATEIYLASHISCLPLIIVAFLVFLFFFWNISLVFYKEKKEPKLKSDESRCFSENCRSIIYENGYDKAVLFIHGFPTTPSMYSYPAEVFRDEGYDVYAPLIPTFGADYKEFEKTSFSQWFSFIDDYYIRLKNRYEKVYVIGVSMGGAMTLKLAEKYSHSPLSPEKIAVLSAPVAYNSLIRDHFVTSWSFYVGRFIALFIKEIGAECVDGKPEGEDGNENWTGYGGTFPRQGLSLIYNLKGIRKDLGRVDVPILSIHDRGDKTVPFGNQKIILSSIQSKDIEAYSPEMPNYRHTHHSLLMYDSCRKEYTDLILSFFKKEDKQ